MEGTRAKLLGEPGDGVRNITTLVNITRLHNVIGAISGMRRGLALARDYAQRREAFGKFLIDQPLHVETLADLAVEFQAGFQLAFRRWNCWARKSAAPPVATNRPCCGC